MWVIRGDEQDQTVVEFVDEGVVGLDFARVPDAEILTRSEIRRFLADGQSTAVLDAQEEVLSAFVREIQVGDSVLVPDESRGEVIVGTITGSYEFYGDLGPGHHQHRRTVDWLARHPISDLPRAVTGVAKQKLTLQQHRDAEWSGYLAQVREGSIGRDPKDRPARSVRTAAAPRRSSRPSTPRVVKPVLTMATCTSCFLQTHPDRMRGNICIDCAE